MPTAHPSIMFFTDFDGTITTIDSNDYLVSLIQCRDKHGSSKQVAKLGYGGELLDRTNMNVLEGRLSLRYGMYLIYDILNNICLRDALVDQMHSINCSLEECIEFQCKYIELDPHFVTFYRWAVSSNVSVVILSGGLQPLIRALLAKFLGPEIASEMTLHSNEIELRDNDINPLERRRWKVKLHDASESGFDKAAKIKEYTEHFQSIPESERPALLFAGDGISDICAARSCDLLFAKSGKGTSNVFQAPDSC